MTINETIEAVAIFCGAFTFAFIMGFATLWVIA